MDYSTSFTLPYITQPRKSLICSIDSKQHKAREAKKPELDVGHVPSDIPTPGITFHLS